MTDFSSALPGDTPKEPFERLCWIMDRLLGPGGCPWDREQTHESLRQYLIEEAYEVYDAIENKAFADLKEELGDVALQVVFHAQLARRAGKFDISDVLDAVNEKLIRRHPHVFGDTRVGGASDVLVNWEEIKKREKSDADEEASLLAGVPASLPALQKAHRMQEKVARVGFDWPRIEGVIEKAREEFEELVAAEGERDTGRVFEEMGDLLFAIVNVSRFLGVQPEEALQATCRKFRERFEHIERRAAEMGRSLQDMTLQEMDQLWDEAKRGNPEQQ